MENRKRYTAEEKVKILREVVEGGKGVSVVASTYSLSPNNIFKWRKQLFEGGASIFEQKRPDVSAKAEEQRAAVLEAKLKAKDEVIACLAEELLALKNRVTTSLRLAILLC
jgi:transposase-like protein